MSGHLETLDDEALFRLCGEGDDPDRIRRAVGILAARHAEALIRYLTALSGRREVAEDLCQEAFIRIYRHARRYREDAAKVRTWLYRIAQNLARNHARDEARKPRVSLEGLGQRGRGADAQDEGSIGLADPQALDPSEAASDNERARRVRAAVHAIPEPYRGALVLCDLEGMSYQEAADVLETKIGTIRSRLFRGREQLARALEPLTRRR